MEDITSRNKEFLLKYYPSLEKKLRLIENTKPFTYIANPKPNILSDKKPLHSRVDPEKEAINLVRGLNVKDGYIFLFMGIGLGYHIEKFRELYNISVSKITLIMVEKSLEAFSLLVKNREISFLEGAYLFVGEDLNKIKEFLDTLNPLSFKGYRIIRLRGDFLIFKSYYTEIESLFKRALSVKISDILTRFNFESLWMKNIIENVPLLINRCSINALRNILLNKPALVIGAGPSLYRQLNQIKEISRSFYLIAVDTALEPLLTSGIIPDFIITLDAGFFNILDFQQVFEGRFPCEGMILVADVVACPEILKHWKGNLYFSETSMLIKRNGETYREFHPLLLRLREYFPHIDSLDCGGSVATTAIEFALYLGTNPILVTGLDLSYTKYITHVNSSVLYTLYSSKANRLNPLPTSFMGSIKKRKLQYLKGINSDWVLSDFVFTNYVNWFEGKKEYLKRVYNVTDEGALLPWIDHFKLEDLIEKLKIKGFFSMIKEKKINPIPAEIFTREASHNFLNNLKKDIKEAIRDLKTDSKSDTLFTIFTKKYPFLRNIFLEVLVLNRETEKVQRQLIGFLNFLNLHIDRSIQKINR